MLDVRKKLGTFKLGTLKQVVAGLVIALCVGGTSPWWFKELFAANDNSEQPKIESGAVIESKPAAAEELPKADRTELEKRQRQLEEELAELKRDRRRDRRRERWGRRPSAGPERDRERAASPRRSLRSETE